MEDLNKSPRYIGYDRDTIDRALRAIAYKWVPGIFTNGRIKPEKNGISALRVGNIKGRAPRNRGSCRIWIEGDHAGDWVDFDDKDRLKGGPCSTIKKHFELDDNQAFGKALDIIAEYGGNSILNGETPLPNGHAIDEDQELQQAIADAEFDFNEAGPLPGTLGETYWNNRKLGPLPAAAFGSIDGDGKPDIKFLEHCRREGRSQPAILARWRTPDGLPTGGIHKTFLKRDGSGHDDKAMRAPHGAGVIMLAPPNAKGELGVGEGIETTAAGMVLFDVPGWAAGDAGGLMKLARWLGEREAGRASGAATGPGSSADQTARIKRLLVWGDAGDAGEGAARTLATAARAAGIAVEVYLPRSGDDLAKDLEQGLPAPLPLTEAEIAALGPGAPADQPRLPGVAPADAGPPIAEQPTGGPGIAAQPAWASEAVAAAVPAGPQLGLSEISARLMALDKGISGEVLTERVGDIVNGRLNPVNEDAMFNLMYRRTGIKKRAIEELARQLKGQSVALQSGGDKRPWLTKIAVNNDNTPKGIMSNAAIVIREAEEIKGSLGFNEFTGMISVLRKFPWEAGYPNPCAVRPWTDNDELAMTEWVQGIAGIHAPRGVIFDAVQRVANEYEFHPVRDYLSSLTWDHISRLDKAASYYFGAEDTKYHREVFKRWLISGVARIYHPGVKADCMTVFEGEQNIGKSSAIRILFDPWFTDQLAEIGTKDSSLELRGIWGAEYGELEGMTRAEAKTIKSFMSRTTDRFRPPYGRMPIQVERQNVFAGTTNEHEYLKDATGGRRFWPIRCTAIDIDALNRDRDQLWAEAVEIYINKLSKWWIDEAAEPELAAAARGEADARYQRDAWEDIISDWVIKHDDGNTIGWLVDEDDKSILYRATKMAHLFEYALGIPDKPKWTHTDQRRIGAIMKRLGWERKQVRIGAGNDRQWVYRQKSE